MFIKENIMLAIAGIKSNKMRSILTMLGIIIGISSVIGIVSIGNAITSSLTSTLASNGATNIDVSISPKSEGEDEMGYDPSAWDKMTEEDCFSLEQIDGFKERFSNDIDSISVSEHGGSGKAKEGYSYANVSTIGVNDGYKDAQNIKLLRGRFISEKDVKGKRKLAVVSDKFVNNMFKNDTNPLGKEIKVYAGDDIKSYVIVGVYKFEASPFDGGSRSSEKDMQTNLYIPVTTATESAKNKNFSYFTVKPKANADIMKLTNDFSKYFKNLYKNNKNWTVQVRNMESALAEMTSTLGKVSLAISVIGAISLLVGGIGVMNIMLVSVTERTKEIGTRKALGAKSSHIKMQFIVESAIICAIGGTIGIVLGIGMGIITSLVLKSPVVISVPTILISFTFSMFIGVFFGYYPANKAAKLDPIEALRYE
ncbi:UNVERIFIED_ORG: ABC transporter permease [Clostridium botulinum]|uniref:FtsX-like permease family protein n=2 Tax=Clostridium botulinum TaxID=1491 RepID=A0A6B4R6Q2_CLOBO|nr:ABC transporter permease [Clostridium botulinum]ACD52672.1 ABC-type transport system, involved in lipoprotein release, permease component [Clostridium botulinum E3 str. Alaska E43]AJF30397.1 ABC transporter permease [Clostridium botulinum]AJF33460.1 ABC transporter permease [Clostridium botulinum]MBN1036262.1 ABC transporter permease [Clostridium botulinum]MBN1059429.1 ABC transporter permease [Clostridium botulinum]